MDKLLNNILDYDKILILSDENNDDLSLVLFKIIKTKLDEIINFYKDNGLYNEDVAYKIRDLYYDSEDYKLKLKRFVNGYIPKHLVRIKIENYQNDGYIKIINIDKSKSFEMAFKCDLSILFINNRCHVFNDKKKRVKNIDINELKRIDKINKLLNKINDNG